MLKYGQERCHLVQPIRHVAFSVQKWWGHQYEVEEQAVGTAQACHGYPDESKDREEL